ncbi:MAG: serpin family protein [Bacteroidetes bacterium]|nr:serpin family protein [Bacteroidota bacterium]
MKKTLFLAAVTIVSFSLFQCNDQITSPSIGNRNLTPGEKSIASSSSNFGLNLFKEINASSRYSNIFISPLSVSTALGMVLNGANGKTYDEMKSTLELTGANQDEVNKAYQSLNELLTQIDPKVIFESANSIWYRQGFTFEQNFLDVNKNYFDASVQGLDFSNPASVDVINNWVKERTKEKITSIIKQIPKEAVMYLINAIYFKGTWKYQFDTSATKQDEFYVAQNDEIKCMMMSQKDTLNYYNTNNYQAVELPYGNGDFSMVIILPSTGEDINSFISQIDENFWNSLLNSMTKQEVNLWLPKFKIEYFINLNNALKSLGMPTAFDPYNADFSKMRPEKDVYISNVLHKTYVNVDEEGTEAAAATAVEISYTAVFGPQNINMKVNHPFIFAIREKNSGTILFIGKVVNPTN